MVNASSPASFTKNLGLGDDYSALYVAVRAGFAHQTKPVDAKIWRAKCGIVSEDQQLIPMRFFLHSIQQSDADFLMPDEFVLRCISQGYTQDIAILSLFSLHLAKSGKFRNTKWPNGRIAGWANDFIHNKAWQDGAWRSEAFSDGNLEAFIGVNLIGSAKSKHKIFTNYRHLLRIAGVISLRSGTGAIPFKMGAWATSACKLLWDRSIYSDELNELASEDDLLAFFVQSETYKLLGCSALQGKSIAQVAAAEYVHDGRIKRFS